MWGEDGVYGPKHVWGDQRPVREGTTLLEHRDALRGSTTFMDPGTWVGCGTAEGPGLWHLPARPKQTVSPWTDSQELCNQWNYSFFSFIFSKILFDSIKCFSFISLFLWMEVIVEARAFRWRPSSLSSPSSLWPWTPGRRPGERQFDYFCMSKDALETVAARKLGSLRSSPSLSSLLIFLPSLFPSPS